MRKIISILLCLCLVSSSLPASDFLALPGSQDSIGKKISHELDSENISREMPAVEMDGAQHAVINQTIQRLLTDKTLHADKSREYNPQIGECLRQLKKLIPQLDIEKSLQSKLAKLINSKSFSIFVLEPEFLESDFMGVTRKGMIVRSPVHWGHKGTAQKKDGSSKQFNEKGVDNNIYVSSRYFNSQSIGGRLGLIISAMVFLVVGEDPTSADTAISARKKVIDAFDQQFKLEEIKQSIEQYIQLKQSIFSLIQKNEREKALQDYQDWVGVVKKLSDMLPSVSNQTIESLIPGDQSAGLVMPEYKSMFARELCMVSRQQWSEEVRRLVDDIIEEVGTVLYDRKSDQQYWSKKLKDDIKIPHVTNLIPESFFDASLFESKREFLASQIQGLTRLACTYGFVSTGLEQVFVNSFPSTMEVRSTVKHELVHYLAHKGQIKIDDAWEHTTYAVDLADKITHACGDDIAKAERNVQLFANEYGPLVKRLYQKGKQLAEDPAFSFFTIKPGQSEKAGYCSIDLLLLEAVKIYEKHGVNADHIRRYLRALKNPPTSPFQLQQYHADRYKSQQDAGLLLAGMFIQTYQKDKVDPLRQMRDFFGRLHLIFGEPSDEDKQWVRDELMPLLERLAVTLYGKKTKFTPGDAIRQLGLWEFKAEEFTAQVTYWPNSINPRNPDDTDRKKHRNDAKDRSVGNLNLAVFRYFYGSDRSLEQAQEEYFAHPAFRILWDILLIPRGVFKGVPELIKKTSGDVSLSSFQKTPLLIQKVFRDKFNLGNPEAEKLLFDSYPVHLQYLDSLLYRWTFYDPKTESLEDPRVEEGSRIDTAVLETMDGGWIDVLFRIDHESEYEVIFSKIAERIWPVYKRLYEEALEEEKNRQLIEQLKQQDQLPEGTWDPGNLTDEEQELLNAFMQSLAQALQDQINQNAQNNVNQAGMGTMPGQAGSMPMPGGQQMQGSQSMPGGQQSPGGMQTPGGQSMPGGPVMPGSQMQP
ncbi:MAG: hypothetical protein GF384_07120, partial [Elusimicrobia bacterium]|nr:hypothetical protein [Elusimicrobiota bacterium]MBD3412443.1 hypothetical protein [Elusimicrobiota bacterium]